MSFFTAKKPSTGLYILIWFLAFVPANIAAVITDELIAKLVLKDIDDFNVYLFISLITTSIITVIVSVFVYKKFPNLKISKVMPWIYILTGMTAAKGWVETKPIFDELSLDPSIFGILLILSYFIIVFGFRYFFVKTKQWK